MQTKNPGDDLKELTFGGNNGERKAKQVLWWRGARGAPAAQWTDRPPAPLGREGWQGERTLRRGLAEGRTRQEESRQVRMPGRGTGTASSGRPTARRACSAPAPANAVTVLRVLHLAHGTVTLGHGWHFLPRGQPQHLPEGLVQAGPRSEWRVTETKAITRLTPHHFLFLFFFLNQRALHDLSPLMEPGTRDSDLGALAGSLETPRFFLPY